jgi:Plasmid pRiA4b ORF-3-like protein
MRQLFSTLHLYQLRFVLARISPMIWRRLVISSETSLAQLHEYIQIAFGEHLHSFRIRGKDYGISYLGGISFDDNPNIVRLSRFRLHLGESFRYEYDFTANGGWTSGWKRFCQGTGGAFRRFAAGEGGRHPAKNTLRR